jgi:hypothetical protein
MRVSANLASESIVVAPGGAAYLPVTVRNAGDTVEAYQVDIVGVPAEWVTVEPQVITLYPASAGDVTVGFHPPRSSSVTSGELPFGIRIVPAEYPDDAVLEEGVLSIEPFADLTARLQPQSRAGRRGARYRIDTDNRGNITEQLSFAASDGVNQLLFSLRPAVIEVANGVHAETHVRVRTRRMLWWGAPREHPFTARMERQYGEPSLMDGLFIQRPVISAGLLKLLAALLALLLALLALWFGLLRPAVRSAAREAANDPAIQQKAQQAAVQAAQSEVAAGRSAGSAAGGANGAVQSAGSQAGGGQAGVGGVTGGNQFSSSISFHTNPNGSASQSYTVPDNQVFLLTDFLVDNVQGDEGTLVVTANGVRVVSFALENFRNQDYHSVTPIRVPAKAKVTLTVVCRVPGTPANAQQAGSCLESLYLNGVMTVAAP